MVPECRQRLGDGRFEERIRRKSKGTFSMLLCGERKPLGPGYREACHATALGR